MKALTSRDERWKCLTTESQAWSAINEVLQTVSPDALLGHSYFFEALRVADRIGVTSQTAAVTQILWHDLLLPQLASILESFNAIQLIPELDEAAQTVGSTTGGSWIYDEGSGLDSRVLIKHRSNS